MNAESNIYLQEIVSHRIVVKRLQYEVERIPEYFMMMNVTNIGSLRVCTGSNNYVLYNEQTKIKLAENICLEKVILLSFEIFADHGYIFLGGSVWLGKLYFIPPVYNFD